MKLIDRILGYYHSLKNTSDLFTNLEDPIRYEVFSAESIIEHAEKLAARQKTSANPRQGRKLSPRIHENGRLLLAAYTSIAESVSKDLAITPPAEWLLDNFHIVEDHLRDIRDHLPWGYYRELPKLSQGPLKDYPRVYEIAWSFVAHTDSHFEPDLLIRFIRAYQRVQPLAIGELWAIPITLRIVLIENLRRIAVRIVGSQQARLEADRIADDLLRISDRSPAAAEEYLRQKGAKAFSPAFIVQLVQRLRHQGPDMASAMQILTDSLAAQGTNPDEIILREHNLQTAANVTVRNIITSMRLISAYSWNIFFEEVSLVDEVLQSDSLFAEMDFTTRDRYRHSLEQLAKGSRRPELEVARLVMAKTEEAREKLGESYETGDWRRLDPGYYLISRGRPAFEKEIGFQAPLERRLLRSFIAHATPAYLGSIAFLTILIAILPLLACVQNGFVAPAGLVLFGLLALFPASDIAIMLLNRLLSGLIGPRHLPRLELKEGIPSSLRTFVVVPAFLASKAETDEQIRLLEVHYLANPDGDVHYALLTDWPDADLEIHSIDMDLLQFAEKRFEELNEQYGPTPGGGKRFFLFHRKRLWNESENKWMGWERKRGKLHEFNRLLRGSRDTSFLFTGNIPPEVPADVRYVITLDADTKLPVRTVNELVGSMAHPLNLPSFNSRLGRVTEGYGILQPRIVISFPARRDRSLYHRLFSGPCGVDPYACAVSDIYQDLFGEGSFTGKGIYDVETFEVALAGRVPENAVLSHDLFEGNFARCGLASDITLHEEFPSHTEVAAYRQHRWARGDWQLLPWIFGKLSRDISLIGRWKMFDNLRRSLSSPGMLLLLLASWLIPAAPQGVWALLVLVNLILPALLSFLSGLVPRRSGISKHKRLQSSMEDLVLGGGHALVLLTLLAHHAWLMLDAVGRTLVRLFITRRKLLQWVTAAHAKKNNTFYSLHYFIHRFLGAEITAALALMLIVLVNKEALTVALPFICLWLASPFVACQISKPPATRPTEILPAEEVLLLRRHARRIWRFFTTFVTAVDHWLPPDNFQEEPQPIIAHRSSPTNFGLYLLSIVAARDFGWISLADVAKRLDLTLQSMEGLPRQHGHFYNWYETRDYRTLEPKYISSVDSGNLAGHLITLCQAGREMIEHPLPFSTRLQGINDTTGILRQTLQEIGDTDPQVFQLLNMLEGIRAGISAAPNDFLAQASFWDMLEAEAKTIVARIQTFSREWKGHPGNEALAWAGLLLEDIRSHKQELDQLMPWVRILEEVAREIRTFVGKDELELWESLIDILSLEIPLLQMNAFCDAAARKTGQLQAVIKDSNCLATLGSLALAFEQSRNNCAELAGQLLGIIERAGELFDEMDFSFLVDPGCRLFSIGYRADDSRLDPSFYDLLASEARLASYIAVAKGQVSPAHWLRLSRVLIPVEQGAALVSWSGSMFEYLMPSLIMYTPRDSLLDQTCRLVVDRQISYGSQNQVPWGVSESAYSTRDLSFNYQYSAFGIPGLGLKRGLGQDLVIAPYATVLAAMYAPAAAAKNFRELEKIGARGPYGFYEAIDFTAARLPEGTRAVVIKAYMAHHQGMSLVALDNVIHDGIMRHRFHREPMITAAEFLLQERMPREVGTARPLADQLQSAKVWEAIQPVLRRFHTPSHRIPSTHLLSNGRYAVMVTAAGSGYSRWQDLAVTRWREDVTMDQRGSFIFLRDSENGAVWSATYQPTIAEPKHYEAVFAEDRARIIRQDDDLRTTLEIILSPEEDVELRHLSISNQGKTDRIIEITSYAEIVLAPLNADIAHPAFSNLFIETEYQPAVNGLVAARRPRSGDDTPVWAAHVLAIHGKPEGGIEYETDRTRFIGRGQTIAKPDSVARGWPLHNTVGNVLDPIFSLRVKVRVTSATTTHITFSTMVAKTRKDILLLADKYHAPGAFERTSTLAWTHAQILLHYLGVERGEAHLFQHLANRLLYSDPSMRSPEELLRLSSLNVTHLWKFGISGDNPIILLRIEDFDDRGIARQLLRAHEYLRLKLLAVDLVILNEKETSYIQDLQNALEGMVRSSLANSQNPQENRGRIFTLRADLMSVEEQQLLQTAARVVVNAREGSLTEQIMRMRRLELKTVYPPRRRISKTPDEAALLETPSLEFFNSQGGFADEGKEYVIVLGPGEHTPAPWINVIANDNFGFQVSESGGGYTWSLNSRENQLTPWSNDPVSDPPGEAFYLCDLESGAVWCPMPLPIRIESATYIVRHGQGYSRFEHLSHGIQSELIQFVSLEDPVKISFLTLENCSEQSRKLSLTAYIEWVLGFSRTVSAPYIITEMDAETGAMFAVNPWSAEFGGRVAFVDLGGRQSAWTGDRIEFIGRNGCLEQPAGLAGTQPLSGKTGAGLDPCSVLQTIIELAPCDRVELVCILGQAEDVESARQLVRRWRTKDLWRELDAIRDQWEQILGKVQVQTPDRSMDLMINRWFLYQTITCRFRARSAFYQAGGAYGFRDQLQDCMAMVMTDPPLVRRHILRAAARQFREGDVQHWWHPPAGKGVRTHFSDDLLWLPYTLSHYLEVTGDANVLDEELPFLAGDPLPPEKEDAYFEPVVSEEKGTLYEHCARTLDLSMKTGLHGLPLMGTGDWNDGMNRVGHKGQGESVWLAWFLHAALSRFIPLAYKRGEQERAEQWRRHAEQLKKAVEKEAWDGAWYRRAYYDDGTPLGSASSPECRIDAIAQSWGVISGAADPERARLAMKSVEEYLVRSGDGLILLFTPAFDKTPLDPGYIKGYPPGIRENGGQYTHAAAWSVIAEAMLGNGAKAHELFAMINPVNRAATRAGMHRYRVEPYVAVADIYSEPPHVGRGGWSWYTGSSAWLYRAGLEWILGLTRIGENLRLDPCIPPGWEGYNITYRHGTGLYLIRIENPDRVSRGVVRIDLDGEALPAAERMVPLKDDGKEHKVMVVMGSD
ncbi:MAG TPA: glucoamylase family protein [Desulfuromonadaceae bacterium]|jgi:cyclic beta-1,2-glucan synthetase